MLQLSQNFLTFLKARTCVKKSFTVGNKVTVKKIKLDTQYLILFQFIDDDDDDEDNGDGNKLPVIYCQYT